MIRCARNNLYTGSTNNLAFRYQEHCLGVACNFTRKYPPEKIAYVEIFDRIELAFLREKQIQGWSRKKKEALINSEFNLLRDLAECQNNSHARNILSHDLELVARISKKMSR